MEHEECQRLKLDCNSILVHVVATSLTPALSLVAGTPKPYLNKRGFLSLFNHVTHETIIPQMPTCAVFN